MEVFIKVMNGLVMTLEEDKIFLCLAALLCEQFADSRMEVPRYLPSSTFFLSVFSSSELLGKNASIQSKLPTAACYSTGQR